jgi:hypothetical protein
MARLEVVFWNAHGVLRQNRTFFFDEIKKNLFNFVVVKQIQNQRSQISFHCIHYDTRIR